jgi:Ca2+-binding RTX toxin-like protein
MTALEGSLRMLKKIKEFRFDQTIDVSNFSYHSPPLGRPDAFAHIPFRDNALIDALTAVESLNIEVAEVESPPSSWLDAKDVPLAFAAGDAVEGGGMFQHPGVSTDMVLTLARMSQAAYRENPDTTQLTSLKNEGWLILSEKSLGRFLGTGRWEGDYFENSSWTVAGAAAIVAQKGSKLIVSFRGTELDAGDYFNWPDVLTPSGVFGGYLRLGFSELLDAVATYASKSANGVGDIFVTGHSLGAGAANQLRQQSTTISGGFFKNSKYVTFATPTIATNGEILNIGFANDIVAGGADAITLGFLPWRSSNSTTANLFSSYEPHSRVGYVDMVRTVTRLSEYYQLLNRRSSVLVGTAGQKDVGAVGFFTSNIVGGEVNYTFAHPTTIGQRIEGSLGNDVVVGSDFGDVINSQIGNDQIEGLGGSDTINAGLGDDLVYTLADLDEIDGGFGNDTIDMRSRTETRTYRFEASATRLGVNGSVFLSAILKNIEVFMGGDVGDTFSMETAGSTFGQIRLVGRGGSDAYRFGSNLAVTSVIDDEGLVDTISIGGARFFGDAQQKSAGSNVYSLQGREFSLITRTSLAIAVGDRSILVENWSQGDYGITLRPFGEPQPSPPPGGGGAGFNPGFGRVLDGFDQAGRRLSDPLVFDLDGDGLELTSASDQSILFDIDGDGFAERTGWVSADDGFLVRDENNNGRIDNVWEMFGDPTQLGFDELRMLDTATEPSGNGNPVINRNDVVWGDLRIWRDLNSNGSTEEGELKALDEVGIFSISLTPTSVDRMDNGNLIFEEASYSKGVGTKFATLSEVFFGFQEVGGPEVLNPNQGAAPAASGLPESRGYGNLWSWSRKAAADLEFRNALSAITNLKTADMWQADGLTERLLYTWADAENIIPTSRGSSFDARKLAVLEAAIGRGFVAFDGALNPNSRTAPFLDSAWARLVSLVSDRVLMQSALKNVLGVSSYSFQNDEVMFDATYSQIEGKFLALGEADRAASLVQFQTILESNERRLGLSPGEAALRLGRLANTTESDTRLFASALRAFSGVPRTDIRYSTISGAPPFNSLLEFSEDQIVVGTTYGENVRVGSNRRILFFGGGGDDSFGHSGSNSIVIMGEGNDSYSRGSNDSIDQITNVRVYGGTGQDRLELRRSTFSQVYGGDGNDQLSVTGTASSRGALSERNSVFGGLGSDTISLSGARNFAYGEAGDDVFEVGQFVEPGGFVDTRFLSIDGGEGNDSLNVSRHMAFAGADQFRVFMGSGNDSVVGTYYHSNIDLGSGNDFANLSLADQSPLADGSILSCGEGNDSVTLDQGGRNFTNEIFSKTLVEPGNGDDTITVLGDSGSLNRTPVFVNSSLGADRLILRGRAVLLVNAISNDVETIEFESPSGSFNTGGYGILLDLQKFTQYRSLEDLIVLKTSNLWTIMLPNSQKIELKRVGISDFSGVVGIFADGSVRGTSSSDRWVGTYGKETYYASSGNDSANGDQGDDILHGELGRDDLFGEWGNDTINGGEDSDLIDGGFDSDLLNGDGGSDQLFGQAGNDTLNGGEGDDWIDGGNGADILNGGGGVDRLIAREGDIIDGGSGVDTAVFDFRQAGGPLFLNLSAIRSGGAGVFGISSTSTGRLVNIEKFEIQASMNGDFVDFGIGSLEAQWVDFGAGNDTINGGSGADVFLGGAGADSIEGASGNDRLGDTQFWNFLRIQGEELGNDTLVGGDGNDSVNGGFGDDLVTGDAGNDLLWGHQGSDTLIGGLGTDELDGGLGVDTIDGGAGFDFASYANATSGLTLFMGGGTFNSGEAKGDVHTSIEGLIGSAFDDIIGGLANNNELRGLNGNDFIYGRAGVDTLLGGDGNDVLDGGLDGDVLRGEAGIDVAYYRDATATVTASLLTGGTGGEATGDTYFDIENIWGSRFGDVLTGDNNGGQVYGFEGNDTLSGLGGDDFFYGGEGFDTLTGGTGVDNFFFLSWNDHFNQYGTLEPYEGGDTFTDFASGADRIILSRYWFGFGNIGGPAAALTETHANFVTNGAAATSRPSLIWNQTNRTLSFDADGNGATQAVLLGTFQQGVTLTLGDIWTA